MQLLMFVLREPDRLPALLAAWAEAGAKGITVLEGHGSGHLSMAMARDDVPLFPSLADILEKVTERRRIVFTVTDDAALVSRIVVATQKICGDLGQPHSGFLFTLPISMALGISGIQHVDDALPP